MKKLNVRFRRPPAIGKGKMATGMCLLRAVAAQITVNTYARH